MMKLIGVELVKLRRYPVTWLVALISVGQGVLNAVLGRYGFALSRHPEVEYIIFIYATARWFCMASLFMTAYAIAGDYSMRTVLNVLSAGVDKKKYYISRLAAQMFFIFGLYICGFAAFIAVRILVTGKVNTALPPAQLLVLFLVMAMQLMAYVAVANMIGVCCKRQALAIFLSEAWIFLALILRIYFMGEVNNSSAGYIKIKGPMAFEPLWVVESVERYLGNIFSFGFLKYAISASVIIVVTSVIGYAALLRSDVQ